MQVAVDVELSRVEISTGTPATLTDFFMFPESLQEHFWIIRRLCHDCLLPNPFQFIIHQ
jgi:hypothetical protein